MEIRLSGNQSGFQMANRCAPPVHSLLGASRRYTFSKPLLPPTPFTHYQAERVVRYRSRFLSIMQAWTVKRVQP